MSDNRKYSDNQEGSVTSGKAFAERRRVVKGIASTVPVIMTVSSGSALANASSLQCIREPEPGSEPPETIKNRSYNIQTDLGGGRYVDTDGWVRKEARGNKLELVYVDQDGETTRELGDPVMQSCYASFIQS